MCKKSLFHTALSIMMLLSAPQALFAKEACPVKMNKETKTAPAKKVEAKGKVAAEAPKKEMPKPTAPKKSTSTGVKDITALNELEDLIAQNDMVVVKFSAKWCGPCQKFAPVFKEVAAEMPNVVFIAVDVDAAKEIADKHKIRGIPTVKYFKKGKGEVKSASGAASKKEFTNNIKSAFGI